MWGKSAYLPYSPRILLFAFGSQLAWRLRDVPAKCTMGNLSPRKVLQSRPSPPVSSSLSSSLSWALGGSILVTCHLTRIRRIAAERGKKINGQYGRTFFPQACSVLFQENSPSSVSIGGL